jgi:ferredoxin
VTCVAVCVGRYVRAGAGTREGNKRHSGKVMPIRCGPAARVVCRADSMAGGRGAGPPRGGQTTCLVLSSVTWSGCSRVSRPEIRIFADKPKCISCNICTRVCHMGIDVMGYASQGRPMDDVECVRCAACVTSCPMDVLSFGMTGKEHPHDPASRLYQLRRGASVPGSAVTGSQL